MTGALHIMALMMTSDFRLSEIPLAQLDDTPCQQFLDYWRDRRGDAWAPTLKGFALPSVPPPLLSSTTIVDVIDGGDDFRYRFWGTAQTDVKGYDLTGKLITDSPGRVFYESGLKQYRRVVEAREPLAFLYETPYVALAGSGRQLSVRAPLAGADDDAAVAHIVAYQNLGMAPQAWEELWDAIR